MEKELKTILNILVVFLIVAQHQVFAQDKVLLTDKPGTFKITYGDLNGHGPDQYNKSCGYTNAEAEGGKKEVVSLIDIFRKNPVLNDIKGFDGYCYLNIGRCNTKFGYGLPSSPGFYFQTWSLRNGKEVKHTIEPPQWKFEVNMIEKFCSWGFNVSDKSDAYNPTNPAFDAQSMGKATLALRELFFLPGVKEEIAPGINRYGDYIILFNPNRPEYWSQVTIREVFRLLFDYYKLDPDKAAMEIMVPQLENEFSNFTETEKDGFAYFGNNESISRIGSEKNETPVMRPNPGYWNRNLPRSAIQFILMEIPPKEVVERTMNDRWKRQDGYYYVSRLLYELDVNTLLPAIEK